jgi:hypothetical protein
MIEEQTPPRTDFYLRLNSEADMPTVLAAFYRQDTTTEFDDETGEETVINVGDPYLVPNTKDYAISIVGTIHKPTGVTLTDADGNEYPETAPLSGHHVNVRIVGDAYRNAVEALDATHGVIPQQPVRVWA